MTYDPTDPQNMPPEDRLSEVAEILARGVLRLRRRAALPAQSHSNLPQSSHSATRLDVSPESRPHATPWLTEQGELR